jgi:predicted transposase YdaD
VSTPVVRGPEQIPVITDPDEALANPELTVLSAIANSHRPETRRPVYEAFAHLLQESEDKTMTLYSALVKTAGPDDARQDLEDIMAESDAKYRDYGDGFINRYVNQGRAEGEVVGRAEGEAKAIIPVLNTRGINVPDRAHERITSCTDLDQLDLWLKKAALVDSVDELFT